MKKQKNMKKNNNNSSQNDKYPNFLMYNMKTLTVFSLIFIFQFLSSSMSAQEVSSSWEYSRNKKYMFINYGNNKINEDKFLAPFFKKLQKIKKTKKGQLNIVHIGDSHIQADLICKVVRQGFQDYFGNAGRGLVFSHQLAKSNAPSDVFSSSNLVWKYNRCAHPETNMLHGITGFGIHSYNQNAKISLNIKNDLIDFRFDKIQLFLGDENSSYTLRTPNDSRSYNFETKVDIDTPSSTIFLDSMTNEFSFYKSKSNDRDSELFSFYGASLSKKDSSGIIYHNVGCNGAQFWQFSKSKLFFKQLKALQGDLYILSFGTNEAQNSKIVSDSLISQMDVFVKNIKSINPNAVILFTTPPGSYFQGISPNKTLKTIVNAISYYCLNNSCSYWDLYNVSGGYLGANTWNKNNLMAKDLVHYTKDGYNLQGNLLLEAFVNSYNLYDKQYPYIFTNKGPKTSK
jgi:hypothetical protein